MQISPRSQAYFLMVCTIVIGLRKVGLQRNTFGKYAFIVIGVRNPDGAVQSAGPVRGLDPKPGRWIHHRWGKAGVRS